MNNSVTRLTIIIITSLVLSSFSVNSIAKDGGSCDFANESVLVQIKSTKEDEITLSTSGRQSNQHSDKDDLERMFHISNNQLKESWLKSDYLLATIKHTMSGACTPQEVINLEKYTIGTLQLQVGESLYYGGAFRFNEFQHCIEQKKTQCEALKLRKYNDAEIKTIQAINAKTVKTCSLDAIRVNTSKLKSLSSTNYILGCATEKNNKKELPLYFEMVNKRLEFRGVIF